jgi:carbon storage regulator
MLVLTRKLMEKLYIGDEICVTVVRLEGGQVRLGIDAPRHIPVIRAELTPRNGSGPAPRNECAPPASNPDRPLALRIPAHGARENDSRRRARSR